MRAAIVDAFGDAFGGQPEVVVRSPGRVNLIGEHTDYNDGFVLPIAIERATWLAAAVRDDRVVRVRSREEGDGTLDLEALAPQGSWLDYIAGCLAQLDGPVGFDLVVGTEIPVGAGLSSSAALELGVLRVAIELAGGTWDPRAMARAGRRAENEFVGIPSGIMDQLVVALGEEGSALLLDCRSLEAEAVPIPEEATVVVLDTGTRRGLVGSEYGDRQAECQRAAAELGVAALRDADLEMVEVLDPDLRRRARHVVTENARTTAAAAALAAGDLGEAGRLMVGSHASLRDDFEVSGPALDTMVEIALAHDACFGARMTGGGFAGCAVALVETASVDRFVPEVAAAYDAATPHLSALFPTRAAAGVEVVVAAA